MVQKQRLINCLKWLLIINVPGMTKTWDNFNTYKEREMKYEKSTFHA